MADTPKPKIFLSYSSANNNTADEIDADFKKIGIILTRDERDLKYLENIEEFMKTVREHNFVLMLISDEYLRSDNCMFEVMELMATNEFKKRVLPIIYDDAKRIIKPEGALVYFDYWKNREEEVTELHKSSKFEKRSFELLERIRHIRNSIGKFFFEITSLKNYSLADLKRQNYQPFLDVIAFENERADWKRVLAENRILEYEKYIVKYPNGHFVNDAKEKIRVLKKLAWEKQNAAPPKNPAIYKAEGFVESQYGGNPFVKPPSKGISAGRVFLLIILALLILAIIKAYYDYYYF